ncbi:425_t:CDS:2, partial [Entrophospora sp. SA101]
MKNFHDFVDLAYELNVPDLQKGSIAYNNEKSGKELLEAVSKTIEYDIWEEISKSPCIGVIIDESNNISTTKNLIVIFIKITSFASDGASVMLGVRNGVAKQLTSYCPYMVVTHCVAHYLALACKSSSKQVDYFKKAETLAKEFQEILDNDILKIKKIFDIRWLSWYEAVRNICKSLEALILTLSNDVSEVSKPLLNIEIIINTIINKLRFEYLPDNNGNIKFGFHLRKFFNNLRFISETRVDFGEFQLNYSYNDHQELLVDIQTYTRSLISCIEEKFPNKPLITVMKIFNPKEWPLNIVNFQEFGINELNLLLDQFGMEKNIKQKDNSYKKFEPLVDKESCIYECIKCEHGFSKQNLIKTKCRNLLTASSLYLWMRVGLEGPDSKVFDFQKA